MTASPARATLVSPREALFEAAHALSASKIKAAIESGALSSPADDNGVSAGGRSLAIAMDFSSRGHLGHRIECLTTLLEGGADPSAPANAQGLSALHLAARDGERPWVEMFLKFGADANARSPKGRTALHLAAARGAIECARALLDYGADPNAADEEGLTTLSLTIGLNRSDVEMGRLLIEKGAKRPSEESWARTGWKDIPAELTALLEAQELRAQIKAPEPIYRAPRL